MFPPERTALEQPLIEPGVVEHRDHALTQPPGPRLLARTRRCLPLGDARQAIRSLPRDRGFVGGGKRVPGTNRQDQQRRHEHNGGEHHREGLGFRQARGVHRSVKIPQQGVLLTVPLGQVVLLQI